jgi:hypothetical protein
VQSWEVLHGRCCNSQRIRICRCRLQMTLRC